MVKIQFTNSTDLLPWNQQFQDNVEWPQQTFHRPGNLHVLLEFTLYEPTDQQYLDNITVIATYKLMDIIAWVLREESRRKAQSLGQGSSLNRFSTMKNLGQKCAKCGKTNHTTQNHWPRGKCPHKGNGQSSQKALSSTGNKKKVGKKAKAKWMKRHQVVPMY